MFSFVVLHLLTNQRLDVSFKFLLKFADDNIWFAANIFEGLKIE